MPKLDDTFRNKLLGGFGRSLFKAFDLKDDEFVLKRRLRSPEEYEKTFSENALWLWAERYYVKRWDPELECERKETTVYEVAQRVTRSLVCEEYLYPFSGLSEETNGYIPPFTYYDWLRILEMNVMYDFLERRFMFGSPVLFNAGFANVKDPELAKLYYAPIGELSVDDYAMIRQAKHKGQMMCSCFTLPVNDMLESDGEEDFETKLPNMGIFNAVTASARISQSGGGVGLNFSKIRPKGSPIGEGDSGYASGPVSFMKLWDTTGEVIVQGGKRRAALMGILDSDHPDIMEFIDCKTQEGVLPYFNISVNVKNSLADAVINGPEEGRMIETQNQWFDVDSKFINSKELWDKLCKSAWTRGDPGVIFMDMAQADNLMQLNPNYLNNTCNPCLSGETKIMTGSGFRPVQELASEGEFVIQRVDGTYGPAKAWQTGIKATVNVNYMVGKKMRSVRCTPDHKFRTCEGDICAKDLAGKRLSLTSHNNDDNGPRVVTVTPAEPTAVYDFSEPEYHYGIIDDYLVVHNCAEKNMPLNTACLLGSINVSEMSGEILNGYDNYKSSNSYCSDLVEQVIRSTYYLDLMVDASTYPLPQIEETSKRLRPLGLGLMGLADLFLKGGISYGDAAAIDLTDNIFKIMAGASMFATVVMGALKGPFPDVQSACDLLLQTRGESGVAWTTRRAIAQAMPLLNDLIADEDSRMSDGQWGNYIAHNGWLRNGQRLTVAPTGSISMLCDTSGGIEPNFAWYWKRRLKAKDGISNIERIYWHPLIVREDEKKEILESGEHPGAHWLAANELSCDDHLNILERAAYYLDCSASKTINLPHSATVEEVDKIYRWCFVHKIKGVTVYRDGSRREQPIEAIKKEGPKKEEASKPLDKRLKKRPPLAQGVTSKSGTPWGSLYTTLTFGDDGLPFEVFVTLGKSGSELKSFTEALSRVISVALRSGAAIDDIISTLDGLSGNEIWVIDDPKDKEKEYVVKSIPDALVKSLKIIMENALHSSVGLVSSTSLQLIPPLQGSTDTTISQSNTDTTMSHGSAGSKGECPECNSPTITIGGCPYCLTCGWSKCK